MAMRNLHLGWVLPIVLLGSAPAVRAVEPGPNQRKVRLGFPVKLALFKDSKALPLGRLDVLDSAGMPVKDPDGDPVYFAGDGRDAHSVEATPVVLRKGEYWFRFTPDRTSHTFHFKLGLLTPNPPKAEADYQGGLYVLQVQRLGLSERAFTVDGEWDIEPGKKAKAILLALSAAPGTTLLDMNQ